MKVGVSRVFWKQSARNHRANPPAPQVLDGPPCRRKALRFQVGEPLFPSAPQPPLPILAVRGWEGFEVKSKKLARQESKLAVFGFAVVSALAACQGSIGNPWSGPSQPPAGGG